MICIGQHRGDVGCCHGASMGLQFSFSSCKFKVQKSKEGTGRVVMWRMGIANSYTLEAAFGGSTLGEGQCWGWNHSETHFQP